MKKYGTNLGLMFLRNGEKKISIYSTTPNLEETVYTTNDNFIWELLKYCSIPKTLKEILEKFKINQENMEIVIDKLVKKELIIINPLTSDDEMFRLNNFVNSLPNVKYQSFLKKAVTQKLVILGVGTAGSYCLELLTKIGLRHFLLIDGDKVEKKNLISQNYSSTDVGKFKVKVLKKRYKKNADIETLSKQVSSYTELYGYIEKYKPQFLFNNADDVVLTLDILRHIFNDFPDLSIIESGYNVTELQSELINKDNVELYIQEFEKMKNKFLKDNKFDGISENSGIIFHAISSALLSTKFVFDSLTEISSANMGRFNFFENKYFFDNSFYFRDFNKYIMRGRQDNLIFEKRKKHEMTYKYDSKTNEISLKKHIVNYNFTEIERMYLLQSHSKEIFNFFIQYPLFKKTNVKENDELLKKQFRLFIQSRFGSAGLEKVLGPKQKFRLFTQDNKYTIHTNYSEKNTNDTGRIYLHFNQGTELVRYFHELLHILFFDISNDSYFHENFVMQNLVLFTSFLAPKNTELYEYFSKQLLNYINSFYPDIYLITEEEKAVITHRQGDIKNEFCNQFGKLNTIQKFYEYFIKYKSDTKPLSELKYVLAVDNNFENIKKLALQLNKKEVRK